MKEKSHDEQVKYDNNYKKKLLLTFFYIAQEKTGRKFKSGNEVKTEFEKFLKKQELEEEFTSKGVGQGLIHEYFKELEEKDYIIRKKRQHCFLSEKGIEHAKDVARNIVDDHLKKIHDHFNIPYKTIKKEPKEDEEKGSLKNPFPHPNAPYDENTFYWFIREDKILERLKAFKETYLKHPWDKNFALIYGPSNSGKSSLVQLFVKLNVTKASFKRNDWVEKARKILKLPSKVHVKLEKGLKTEQDLNDWIEKIINRIVLVGDRGRNHLPSSSSFVDQIQYLNERLLEKGKKCLLVLDQGESLIDHLVTNETFRKKFIIDFLFKLKELESIAFILVISEEYHGKLYRLLDEQQDHLERAEPHRLLISHLTIDLVDQILESLQSVPEELDSNFRRVMIPKEAMMSIKKAMKRNGNLFQGTELILLLNELVKKYSASRTDSIVNIPKDLTVEECKQLIKNWLINVLEKRANADDEKTKIEWELLKNLYFESPNHVTHVDLAEVKRWVEFQIQQSTESVSLEEMLRSLADDGLIELVDEDRIGIRHQFLLQHLQKLIKAEDLELMKLRKLWEAELVNYDSPRLDTIKRLLPVLNSLPTIVQDDDQLTRLAEAMLKFSGELNFNEISLPSNLLETKILPRILFAFNPSRKLDSLYQLFMQLKKGHPRYEIVLKAVLNDEKNVEWILSWPWREYPRDLKSRETLFQWLDLVSEWNDDLSRNIQEKMLNNIKSEFTKSLSELDYLIMAIQLISRINGNITDIFDWNVMETKSLNDLNDILVTFLDAMTRLRARSEDSGFNNSMIRVITDFFQNLRRSFKWKEHDWKELNFIFLKEFLKQLENVVSQLQELSGDKNAAFYPDELLEQDWNGILRQAWTNDPKTVLDDWIHLQEFWRRILERWDPTAPQSFPNHEDFLNARRLGYLNDFIDLCSHLFRYTTKELKIADLLQELKEKGTLRVLMANSYHQEIQRFRSKVSSYFISGLPKFYIKDITDLISEHPERLRFLNEYHSVVDSIINRCFKDVHVKSQPLINLCEFYTPCGNDIDEIEKERMRIQREIVNNFQSMVGKENQVVVHELLAFVDELMKDVDWMALPSFTDFVFLFYHLVKSLNVSERDQLARSMLESVRDMKDEWRKMVSFECWHEEILLSLELKREPRTLSREFKGKLARIHHDALWLFLRLLVLSFSDDDKLQEMIEDIGIIDELVKLSKILRTHEPILDVREKQHEHVKKTPLRVWSWFTKTSFSETLIEEFSREIRSPYLPPSTMLLMLKRELIIANKIWNDFSQCWKEEINADNWKSEVQSWNFSFMLSRLAAMSQNVDPRNFRRYLWHDQSPLLYLGIQNDSKNSILSDQISDKILRSWRELSNTFVRVLMKVMQGHELTVNDQTWSQLFGISDWTRKKLEFKDFTHILKQILTFQKSRLVMARINLEILFGLLEKISWENDLRKVLEQVPQPQFQEFIGLVLQILELIPVNQQNVQERSQQLINLLNKVHFFCNRLLHILLSHSSRCFEVLIKELPLDSGIAGTTRKFGNCHGFLNNVNNVFDDDLVKEWFNSFYRYFFQLSSTLHEMIGQDDELSSHVLMDGLYPLLAEVLRCNKIEKEDKKYFIEKLASNKEMIKVILNPFNNYCLYITDSMNLLQAIDETVTSLAMEHSDVMEFLVDLTVEGHLKILSWSSNLIDSNDEKILNDVGYTYTKSIFKQVKVLLESPLIHKYPRLIEIIARDELWAFLQARFNKVGENSQFLWLIHGSYDISSFYDVLHSIFCMLRSLEQDGILQNARLIFSKMIQMLPPSKFFSSIIYHSIYSSRNQDNNWPSNDNQSHVEDFLEAFSEAMSIEDVDWGLLLKPRLVAQPSADIEAPSQLKKLLDNLPPKLTERILASKKLWEDVDWVNVIRYWFDNQHFDATLLSFFELLVRYTHLSPVREFLETLSREIRWNDIQDQVDSLNATDGRKIIFLEIQKLLNEFLS